MEPAGKVQELEAWERAKAARAAAPPQGFVGGHGYPDPEIYKWVDRLNQLHRLCTLQSCAGHRCTTELHCGWCDEQPVGTACAHKTVEDLHHLMSGQLWLWPDEKLARYFYEHAPFLALLPGVEKVSVLWHVEGREIIDIQFKGAGHGALDASMKGIMVFFEEASWRCNLA